MIYCDFCGKSQKDVFAIITGTNGAAICGECALTCATVIMGNIKKAMDNNAISLKETEECKNE